MALLAAIAGLIDVLGAPRIRPVVSGGTTDAGWMGWQMVYRDHVAVSDEAGRKTVSANRSGT
jgi:hypothetical protein